MNLNRLRLGARMGGGFALILTLLALMMACCIWRLDRIADASRATMGGPLAKERLVEEWARNVAAGIRRTTAIAKSSDASLAAVFADDAKTSTARGNEIDKTLRAMPSTPDEGRLLEGLDTARKAYLASRDEIMKLKREGKPDEANRVFDERFMPAARAYPERMQALLAFQHQEIDRGAAAIDADAGQARVALFALGALALVVGGLAAWLLTRSVTRPLARAAQLVDAVAEGNLTENLAVDGRDEIADLMRGLGRMNDSLREMVVQVRQVSDSIGTASSEIATGNHDLSVRTEQTASNLQQTASSMEQLTGTLGQSADSARQANQLATSAAQVAQRGGAVVSQVVATMNEIDASSKRIADIIGVIDGIAFQTNILALNAAVEAARAGEQGRGFAVVASEVRALAQRSAAAAREIKGLIAVSVEKVGDGSKLVATAGATMSEIVGSVQRVSDMIGDVTAAATEQSQGIGEVNGAVTQLDQMTQQNAALVEQSAAAAESLREQAGRLAQVVATFRLRPAG
jgi:methyl-accepting chemotaxis protein